MGCCSSAPVENSYPDNPPSKPVDAPAPKTSPELDTLSDHHTSSKILIVHEGEYSEDSFEFTEDEYNLAGYKYEKIIGRGASAVVVQMAKDDKHYAVKVCDLHRAKINFIQITTHDPKEEAAILKRFDHPHVVKVFDFIEDTDNDKVYIVMELLDGGTIMDCKTIDEIRNSFSEALSAVQYIHFQRIAHRDIKTDNIMRHDDGTVRLCDFGISVFVPENVKQIPVELVGTPAFSPPETFTCATYDPFAADIWSLGVTLYAVVFQKLPFIADNRFDQQRLITQEEPEFPEDANPDAVDLIKKMMKKKPEERIKVDDIWYHPFMNEAGRMISQTTSLTEEIFRKLLPSDRRESILRVSRGSLRSSLRNSFRNSVPHKPVPPRPKK